MREGRGGQDSDSVSGCSADMSNTDSGRGPSEDGDHGRHDAGPDSGLPPPPPYDSLWEEKRRSSGSGELRPVPEEATRRMPPSDINNIIPPYTTTFSPTRGDATFTARRFPGQAGAQGKPQPITTRRVPPRVPNAGTNAGKPGVGGCVGGGRTLNGPSPRSSPQGSRDSLHDLQSPSPRGDAQPRVDGGADNGPKHHPASCGTGTDKKRGGEEVIYVNTFGHRMPLHPLGRVDETLDEGSDDSASSSTSGSFEVDQGDRCSGNSVQTVINAGQMDTVV